MMNIKIIIRILTIFVALTTRVSAGQGQSINNKSKRTVLPSEQSGHKDLIHANNDVSVKSTLDYIQGFIQPQPPTIDFLGEKPELKEVTKLVIDHGRDIKIHNIMQVTDKSGSSASNAQEADK